MWSVINSLINNKTSKTHSIINTIEYDGHTACDSNDISNAFNDFFSTVGSKLSRKCSSAGNHKDFMNDPVSNSIFLSPISVNEVCKLIDQLKPGKAPGLDGIPNSVLKSISHIVSPILASIFNKVIDTGIYPDILKNAKIIPVFKKGNKKLPENYRPISLLSCTNKLLESVLEKRFRSYLDNNKILYDYQFGFRAGHSTCHALLDTVNTIRGHLDNGSCVLGLYLDLKKAFDTVDHDILLRKAENYGFRGKAYTLLSSYLHNRKQCTFVNNVYSRYQHISTGVPQGSVLGPLLFLIYINDINNAVPDVSTRLFADDTNVFLFNKKCDILISDAKNTLIKLSKWFAANKLTLHLGKTSYTIFHPNSIHNHYCPNSFSFNGEVIKRSPYTKYLGLIIDEKLSWSYHINDLCKKILSYTGIFYRIRDTLPPACALQLYYAFVYSRISYGIEIYGMASASTLKPLQIMQNRILKTLTKKPRNYSTILLYKNLGLLMINDIHKKCFSTILYKYCNGMLPSVMGTSFLLKNRQNNISTRNSNYFTVTRHNNIHGKLTLNNYGYKIWQSLPDKVKKSKSICCFNKNIKIHLSLQYN